MRTWIMECMDPMEAWEDPGVAMDHMVAMDHIIRMDHMDHTDHITRRSKLFDLCKVVLCTAMSVSISTDQLEHTI